MSFFSCKESFNGSLEQNMSIICDLVICYLIIGKLELNYKIRKENQINTNFIIDLFTEDLLLKWIKNAIKETGIHKIACAGGVFMNVKANMRIMEMDEVDDIFIFPSCGDESLAIGAAYSVYADHILSIKKYSRTPLDSIYFGPEYSMEEIEGDIKNELDESYSIERITDMPKYIAEKLADGEILARFDERMEFGQRSLGNRSILANPSSYDTIREINMAIKQRDFWMPFAPSILDERQNDVIINPKKISAPYMIMAFRINDNIRKNFSAAIHPYDFTARPQILKKSFNINYHKLITEFDKITGIPGVLNTSFNLHGDPIVCSPSDAIKTLKKSGLKHLAIGSFFISKNSK